MRALAAVLLCLAVPARADLSFLQVTQAQSSAGADGLFGKTWVEIRAGQMRLVSGYARKVPPKGGAPDPQGRVPDPPGRVPDPRRRVEILDVKERTRTIVDPTRRIYAVTALGPPGYGAGLEATLARGKAERRIVRHEISLEKRPGQRKLLGADCELWRVRVTMRLLSLNGREEAARMDQSLWVAPLTGDLAKSLMELIEFENSYRAGTHGALSPIDFERYQVRGAAAYLQVPEADLAKVVAAVRERLREVPSYPVASSVSWWRDEGRSVRPPEGVPLGALKPRVPEPARTQPVRLQPRKKMPSFHVINWRREERRIDGMLENLRSEFGAFPLGGLRPPTPERPVSSRRVYPRFEEELRTILKDLIAQEAALDSSPEPVATSPFFEIYTELHGLEKPAIVAEGHFQLPKKYRKVAALPKDAGG